MIEFRIPLAIWVNSLVDFLYASFAPVLDSTSSYLEAFINLFEDALVAIPPILVMVAMALIVGRVGGRRLGLFSFVGLVIIYGLALWEEALSTIALIITSVIIALLLGIPVGILASQYGRVEKVLRPVLDFMQTLPSFVYLIPAIMFFGLGKVAALVSTLIFSIPPVIRLTVLGIKQVPEELVEASNAFGATRSQRLLKVQLPLAMPSIMAGVNQTIMLALAMVVIAAMIGAGGLGGVVLRAMQTVDIGFGMEGGLAIVILAIILDRTTEALSANYGQVKKDRNKTAN